MKVPIRDSGDLRKLREDAGFDVATLALKAQVDGSTINRIENGQDPRLSTWNKLLAALLPAAGNGEGETATQP